MLLLTLPGTPNTYYGEELGMENINITGSQDPAGKYDLVKTSSLEVGLDLKCSCNHVCLLQRASRDPQRAPMQWSDDVNAGFNSRSNVTWLPVHPAYKHINVEVKRNSASI